MAYQSYGMAAQPQPTNQTIPSQFPQQNVQPLFPQPQGNVYSINSTLEVANVPVGAGISVALCLPENVMSRYCEKERDKIVTVGDFANLKLKGIWLCTMRGHITCIIDGTIYDTFNPSDHYLWCAYQVE